MSLKTTPSTSYGRFVAVALHASVEVARLVEPRAQLDSLVDAQAPGAQALDDIPLLVKPRPLHLAHAIAVHLQRTRGGDARVQLPQRPGRRIAGVGEDALAGLLASAVEFLEGGSGQQDLAPSLQHGGDRGGSLGVEETQRHRLDRPEVVGHVLADIAVAPGGAGHEMAVAVHQLHR